MSGAFRQRGLDGLRAGPPAREDRRRHRLRPDPAGRLLIPVESARKPAVVARNLGACRMRLPELIRGLGLAVAIVGLCAPAAHADEAEGHYRTGLALERKGDLAGATREVREAVRLKPDHAAAWMTLG